MRTRLTLAHLGFWLALMGFSYGAEASDGSTSSDVDIIRMHPEVVNAFGSLLDMSASFYTWPSRVVFLEEALSDYAQQYFRVKGVQIYSGPDFGLMVSGAIRNAIPEYQVASPPSDIQRIHGDVQRSEAAQAEKEEDSFFSFDGVNVGLDDETRSVLKVDLLFGFGYRINRYLRPSVKELQDKYDIHILPDQINLDAEKNETLTLALQMPFKMAGGTEAFNLGTNLESKLILAARTKTTFKRQTAGVLGVYNEVNLRSNIGLKDMPDHEVMAQFNFVTQLDVAGDPLNLLNKSVSARFCLKEAAVHFPRKGVNLMYGSWFGTGVSYVSDVNMAVEGFKTVASLGPISLDMFFPLAEKAANEHLKTLPHFVLMTDKQLEQVPEVYQCAPYVHRRRELVLASLLQAKAATAQLTQLVGPQSTTSRVLEYTGAGLLTVGEVESEVIDAGRNYLLRTGKSLPQGVKDWTPGWVKGGVKWILGE